MAGKRVDKLTAARRAEAVYQLILRGNDREQILQNVAIWQLSDRQIDNYIARAWERIKEAAARGKDEHRAEVLAFLRQTRREAETVREKVAVVKAEAEIAGLVEPKQTRNLNLDMSALNEEQLERIANGEDPFHVLASS